MIHIAQDPIDTDGDCPVILKCLDNTDNNEESLIVRHKKLVAEDYQHHLKLKSGDKAFAFMDNQLKEVKMRIVGTNARCSFLFNDKIYSSHLARIYL